MLKLKFLLSVVLVNYSMLFFLGSYFINCYIPRASQVALVVKNPPANAGAIRDVGPIPGLGRSPGGGHSIVLQYCLENPMNRRAWWAIVHEVAKSQT